MSTYQIKRGDTLSAIAKQNGTTVQALAAANGISNPNKIRAGAEIVIPGTGGASAMGGGAGAGRSGAYAQAGSNTAGGYARTNTAQYSGTAAGAPHISGYTGPTMTDARGKQYTNYGAYLRTDGFYYPNGARISPNGMYYDTGNGWEYAGTAVGRDPKTGAYYTGLRSDVAGYAPNTRLDELQGWDLSGGGRSGASGRAAGGAGANAGSTNTGEQNGGAVDVPTAEEIDAYLRLLEYSYNGYIQPGWEEYSKSGRMDY